MSELDYQEHARILSEGNEAVLHITQELLKEDLMRHFCIEGLFMEFEKHRERITAMHELIKGYESLIEKIIPKDFDLLE